eukprot:9488939-Pyramimonas_sp.AAC.1
MESLGILPKDSDKIVGTSVHNMWTQYKECPSHDIVLMECGHDMRDGRDTAIPVFYRTCQGHSTFVASIERMYVPYDPGQVRSHGPLLRIADLQTFLESADGR